MKRTNYSSDRDIAQLHKQLLLNIKKSFLNKKEKAFITFFMKQW